MNIEEQRKAFEEWAKKKGLTRARCEETGVYFNQKTFYAWKAWLAAQNQGGYVLVQAEPILKMLEAASKLAPIKAMIEA